MLSSPRCFLQDLPRSKVDGLVPHNQSVNLTVVCQRKLGAQWEHGTPPLRFAPSRSASEPLGR